MCISKADIKGKLICAFIHHKHKLIGTYSKILCFDGPKGSCRSREALILIYKLEPLSQMLLDHKLSSAVVFPF